MPENCYDGGSDEALLETARGGDQGAFRVLFERHAAKLEAQARRKIPPSVRRRVSESDVVQDACLVAFRRLDDFRDRGPGSFLAWLRRIVELKTVETLRHHLGAARRMAGREVTRGGRPETANLPAREPSPSERAVGRELRRRVEGAVAQLSEDHGAVIRLIHAECLNLDEAAARLDRSPEAVRKLYARALARLANDLGLSRGGT